MKGIMRQGDIRFDDLKLGSWRRASNLQALFWARNGSLTEQDIHKSLYLGEDATPEEFEEAAWSYAEAQQQTSSWVRYYHKSHGWDESAWDTMLIQQACPNLTVECILTRATFP